MTLREKILSAKDLTTEIIEVPEWGCKIGMRCLTSRQRGDVLNLTDDDGVVDQGLFNAHVLVKSAYNPEDNTPLFELADVEALGGKNGEVMETLAQKALKLSGVSAKAVKTAEKNL